jgi:hypothetical protein
MAVVYLRGMSIHKFCEPQDQNNQEDIGDVKTAITRPLKFELIIDWRRWNDPQRPWWLAAQVR